MAEKKGDLQAREYRLALQKSKLLTQAQGIDAVMNQNKLDAVTAPSGGVAWTTDNCEVCGAATIAQNGNGVNEIREPALRHQRAECEHGTGVVKLRRTERVGVRIDPERNRVQLVGDLGAADPHQTAAAQRTQRDDEPRILDLLPEQGEVCGVAQTVGVRRETESDARQPPCLDRDFGRSGRRVRVQVLDPFRHNFARDPCRLLLSERGCPRINGRLGITRKKLTGRPTRPSASAV